MDTLFFPFLNDNIACTIVLNWIVFRTWTTVSNEFFVHFSDRCHVLSLSNKFPSNIYAEIKNEDLEPLRRKTASYGGTSLVIIPFDVLHFKFANAAFTFKRQVVRFSYDFHISHMHNFIKQQSFTYSFANDNNNEWYSFNRSFIYLLTQSVTLSSFTFPWDLSFRIVHFPVLFFVLDAMVTRTKSQFRQCDSFRPQFLQWPEGSFYTIGADGITPGRAWEHTVNQVSWENGTRHRTMNILFVRNPPLHPIWSVD